MASLPFKGGSYVTILCVLLTITQQITGRPTHIEEGGYDDGDSLFRNKLATGQTWVGDNYFTLAKIIDYFKDLVNRQRDLVTMVKIGKSLQQKQMWAVHFTHGRPMNNRKMKIWVQCLIHAREWVSGSVCLYLSEAIIQTYQEMGRQAFRALFDEWEFIIIPVVNPDGYEYTWEDEGDRFWRMNRAPFAVPQYAKDEVDDYESLGDEAIIRAAMTKLYGSDEYFKRKFCMGVDLNRNFPYKWGVGVAIKIPCLRDAYIGPSPASEPETRVIMNHFTSSAPILAAIDFHSYSQRILTPWGCETEIVCRKSAKILDAGARALQEGLQIHGKSYLIQTAYNFVGKRITAGPFIDWAFSDGVTTTNKLAGKQAYKPLAYAVELSPENKKQGAAGFVFDPSGNKLDDLAWEASLGAWKLFLHVRQYHELQKFG